MTTDQLRLLDLRIADLTGEVEDLVGLFPDMPAAARDDLSEAAGELHDANAYVTKQLHDELRAAQ